MAYNGAKLDLIDQPLEGVRRRWLYVTADSFATVQGAGYFSDGAARGMLLGDVVWVLSGTFKTTGGGGVGGVPVVGVDPEWASLPAFAGHIVSAITAGAATVIPLKKSTITDNSGGTANATTGIVAAASKYTASIPIAGLANLANAQVYKLAIPHAFLVTSIGVRIGKPATTAAKLATLTAQVSGVAVTGGVVSLTSANATPTGNLVAGTAITALNSGAAAGTVEAAISAVTAFVEGDATIEFGITNTDLANAIATLIAF